MSIEKLDFSKTEREKIPYTIIHSKVLQTIKNAEAGFVWAYLSSLPPDWNVNRTHLKNHFGFGRDKLKSILSYLHQSNLIEYVQEKNTDGTFSKCTLRVLCGDKFVENHEHISVSPVDGFTVQRIHRPTENPPYTNTITNTKSKKINKSISIPSENLLDGFDEISSIHPNKKNLKKAREIYARKKLYKKKHIIIDHLKLRVVKDVQWKDHRFIPMLSTFLNNDRWEDVYQEVDKPNHFTGKQNVQIKSAFSRMMMESIGNSTQGETYEQ